MGGRVEPKKEDLILFFFCLGEVVSMNCLVIFTSKPGAPGSYFWEGVETLNEIFLAKERWQDFGVLGANLLGQWLNGLNGFWDDEYLVGKISRSNFFFSGSRTAE